MKTIPTVALGVRQIDADPAELLKDAIWERRWCGNPNAQKGEGTYYRYVENIETRERCLQVAVFYDVQWFPYHPHDFSPIYFYFDERDRLVRILYDYFHHKIASLSAAELQELRVVICTPWHTFRINETHWAQRLFHSPYLPLTDDILRTWWLFDGMRQFKLRSKFVDPWHPHLFPENVPHQATFRDEAPCPVCGEVFHLNVMKQKGGIFSLDIRCRNRHAYTAIYDAFTQQMETKVR